MLIDLNINFKQQFRIENKCYDFYLPNYNILIEVDGRYWHNRNDSIINDKYKNELAKRYNYKLVRIWDDEIDIVWRLIN